MWTWWQKGPTRLQPSYTETSPPVREMSSQSAARPLSALSWTTSLRRRTRTRKPILLKLKLSRGEPPGSPSMTTAEPAVSLQWCKNLVGRICKQDGSRTRPSWCIRSSTTSLTSQQQEHQQRFLVLFCSVNAYKGSFFPTATHLWNNLPASALSPPSLDEFKIIVCADIPRRP